MKHTEINKDTLDLYCYENGALCKEIKAIVLSFHGLYENGLNISQPNDTGDFFAEKGLLYLMPFYGSLSWMNDIGVRMTDAIVDAAREKYNLPEDIRIVSTGLSMGGLASLTYPLYTKYAKNICAVASNSPVCDIMTLAEDRNDIYKTLYVAFEHYDMPIADAARTVAPLYNVDKLPRVPYFIVQGSSDTLVLKAHHSDLLVPKMLARGLDVMYVIFHNRDHCAMDELTVEGWRRFIIKNALGE